MPEEKIPTPPVPPQSPPGVMPWHRQPGESARAFYAFTIYRDLGPKRSLLSAWKATNRQRSGNDPATVPGQWTQWATKNQWTRRVREFDHTIDQHRLDVALECEQQLKMARLDRQVTAQSPYENFAAKFMSQLETALPEMLLAAHTVTSPEGEKVQVRRTSPVHLARLIKELRALESALQHGFPAPGTHW